MFGWLRWSSKEAGLFRRGETTLQVLARRLVTTSSSGAADVKRCIMYAPSPYVPRKRAPPRRNWLPPISSQRFFCSALVNVWGEKNKKEPARAALTVTTVPNAVYIAGHLGISQPGLLL